MALCDASSLPNAARCFSLCVPDGYKRTLNTYLLAQLAGGSMDPATLLAQSSQFQVFRGGLAHAAKVYLMAVASGYSGYTPQQIVDLAACFFSCIPPGDLGDVETYLWAVNAGGSTDPQVLLPASAAFQRVNGHDYMVELYLLTQITGITDPQTIINGAKCFLSCLSQGMLFDVMSFLMCQGLSGGNIIPVQSTYGSDKTFSIAINHATYYQITWGANDVSANVCGTVYTSTGTGTNTVFYSGTCTLLTLTGTFAGTSVTALVRPVRNVKSPPSNFQWTLISSTQAQATWDTPPAGVTSTELWTSTDGVNYSLAATVAAPGTSATVSGPATAGSTLYGEVRWIYTILGNGPFATPLKVYGAVSDWAARVVTNGGAAVSTASVSAANTFYRSLDAAGTVLAKIKALNFVAPDSVMAALTPLIKTFGQDPWKDQTGGTTHFGVSSNGIIATAASIALATGVIPSTCFASTSTGGLSCYCTVTTAADGSAVDIGSNISNAQTCQLYTNFNSAFAAGQIYNNTTGSCGMAPQGTGFYCANVTGAAAAAIYYGSSATGFITGGTIATGGGTRPTVQIYGMGLNANGATTGTTQIRRYSFFAIHDGFTSTEAQAFYNAVQALRVAFGGGFV